MGFGPFGEKQIVEQEQQATAQQQHGFYQQAEVEIVIVLYHKIDQGQDTKDQTAAIIDLEGQQDDHQDPRQCRGKEGGQEGQHTEDVGRGPVPFCGSKDL